jgi:hypothetical protein
MERAAEIARAQAADQARDQAANDEHMHDAEESLLNEEEEAAREPVIKSEVTEVPLELIDPAILE